MLREIRERLEFLDRVGLGYLSLDRRRRDALGRRGAAHPPRDPDRLAAPRRALRPRRAVDRTAPARQPPTARARSRICATSATRSSSSSTTRRRSAAPTTSSTSGPGAGAHGGDLVARGYARGGRREPRVDHGQYLSGAAEIAVPETRRALNGKTIVGPRGQGQQPQEHRRRVPARRLHRRHRCLGLGQVDARQRDPLSRARAQTLPRRPSRPGEHRDVDRARAHRQGHRDRPVADRAHAALEPGDLHRALHARSASSSPCCPSRASAGYKAGRFSFNVKGGRCEACQGDGLKCIEMNFLPDVYVLCDVCRGRALQPRDARGPLQGQIHRRRARHDGRGGARACSRTSRRSSASFRRSTEVGLGYIKLGQSATTLSGGRRSESSSPRSSRKRATGRTFYILDEPTTGLHFEDVRKSARRACIGSSTWAIL